MSSLSVRKSNKVILSTSASNPIPYGGKNTQVLMNVGGFVPYRQTNTWCFPEYYIKGKDLFPENTIDISSIIITANYSWNGGVLAPNGNIYLIPGSQSTPITILNPYTNGLDFSTISNPDVSDNNYYGGIVAPNGKLFCTPYNSSRILVVDTFTNNISYIDVSSTTSSNRWVGGCLAPNGNIYMSPYNDNNVLIVNPNTSAVSYLDISGLAPGIRKFQSAVMGTNGNIYLVPCSAQVVVVVNPFTNTASVPAGLAGLPGGFKFSAGAIASNGKIYMCPDSVSYAGVVDTSSNTYTQISIPELSSGVRTSGAVCARDGNVYFMPRDATFITKINTATDTYSIFGSLSSQTDKYVGGVLGPNHKIFAVAGSSKNVGIIKTGLITEEPWMMAAEFNKL